MIEIIDRGIYVEIILPIRHCPSSISIINPGGYLTDIALMYRSWVRQYCDLADLVHGASIQRLEAEQNATCCLVPLANPLPNL